MSRISLLAAVDAGAAPHPIWAAPFALLLVAIAILPLLDRTRHWWEHNRNKLLVALTLAAATLAYYFFRAPPADAAAAGPAAVAHVLRHALIDEYAPFMTLLFSLYVISGGILLRGDIRATPNVNTAFLAVGGLLASVIGTTGAAMILIRPLLRTNRERRHVAHTVVFFIFIVCNVGGSLTPLGDPPLFLGYLRGVPYFWTLHLLPGWALMLAALLIIYRIWDGLAHQREEKRDLALDRAQVEPLRIAGGVNLLWLGVVVLGVALLTRASRFHSSTGGRFRFCEGVQLAAAAISLMTTPVGVRAANEFNYTAIGEVACLFLGIFVTMQAPIEMLHVVGPALAARGFDEPWHFFWATGILSSVLDNAPTYVVFFETANHLTTAAGPGVIRLVSGDVIREDHLAAISYGAVFMGANTYIGNGPNFMVKSIAEQAGVRMPSFFGFTVYSGLVLLPLFVLLTLVLL